MDDGQTITGIARRVTGLPVIANGGMHQPEQSGQVLRDGHADLVSVGTGALANPDLPAKLAAGAPLEAFDHAMLHPDVTIAGAAEWRRRR